MFFVQMLLIHLSMKLFHLQGDYGQNCLVQQIIMQICIAQIFHVPIYNSIKGAIPIEHLCLKCNISNSKIQIIHYKNYFSFIQWNNNHCAKYKKTKIYQNEFENKQMKQHLTKLTIVKSRTWQNKHLHNCTFVKEAKKNQPMMKV